MEKAMVFNIQRYSLHDGGGIRTVIFFKGCPLTCPWCSNPESQSFEEEIMKKQSLCIKCSSSSCFNCTNTSEDCPTGAIETIGKKYTIKELLEEVKRDMVFYETTGGGVTLSGGEPLSQGMFIVDLLKTLKELGINTAIETTGMGAPEVIKEMARYIDTVLWDFKIMDKAKAKEILNQDIDIMKCNFRRLMEHYPDLKVIPRLPIIPEYTSHKENIDGILDFISEFNIKEVHLLPFHQYGSSKYKALGREYELMDLKAPNKESVDEIKTYIEKRGFDAIIGGY